LEEALADGLVALCPAADGDGTGYELTPRGEAWLRDFPKNMLLAGQESPGCAERA
jgi:hypothetical protein